MKVIQGLDSSELNKETSVAAIGVFDGVHRGHQKVINEAITQARNIGARSVVITFNKHPREIIKPGSHPPILTSPELKKRLIAGLNADLLVVIEFDKLLASLKPDEFMDLICQRIGIIKIVVGENFRYGAAAAGNLEVLQAYGAAKKIEIFGIPLLKMRDQTVSSTWIRAQLKAGDIDSVKEALGRFPLVTGTVVPGHGRGGSLGYHTANIRTREKAMLPSEGVYAGYIWVGDRKYPGAINIGKNPTFGGERRQLEVFILDFDSDVYGEEITLEFRLRLRDENKFASAQLLAEQIAKDVKAVREKLSTSTSTSTFNPGS